MADWPPSPDDATRNGQKDRQTIMDAAITEAPVTVTDRAVRRIAKILGKEPAGTMLRVSVEGGGCSGFQYKYDLVTSREDDDFVIERDAATVLIDSV